MGEKATVATKERTNNVTMSGVRLPGTSGVCFEFCFFDSGRNKRISRKFAVAAITPAKATAVFDTEARSHPIAGPIRNPRPNIAPISHIFFILVAGVDISETYACVTPIPDHASPAINLPTKKNTNVGAKIREMYPSMLQAEVQRSILLRQ